MAHIVFIMFSENSAYRASLGAASLLREAGHDITYLGIEPYRQLVEKWGFRFQVFGYDEALEASLQKENEARVQKAQQKMKMLKPLRLIRLRMKLDNEAHQRLEQKMKEDLAAWVCRESPDLIFLDQLFMWAYALPLLEADVPLAGINCILSDEAVAGIPPVTTDYIPADPPSRQDEKEAKKKWNRMYRKRLWDYWFSDSRKLRKQIAGTGTELRWQEFGYKLSIPEVVLFPPEFEFSSKGETGQRRYVGGFTGKSHHHSESNHFSEKYTGEKKLIYMSFGNIVTGERYAAERERLCQAFLSLMKTRPELYGIMQVSDKDEAGRYQKQAGENVEVVHWVDQVAVLRSASLFISHCGCSSIREAMHFSVPVFGIPFDLDQPGNAARLQYHGAGVMRNPAGMTSEEFEDTVLHMLKDPAFRRKAKMMQKAFDRPENEEKLLEFVNRYVKKEKADNEPISS
ncbi:glycosyltransferase [Roseivirga sp. BDSF3-8]|uniref:glycosyltransferase n=1 Tax=Roseivirga sp. BDSF3-8 TaxID=3241598 RepID=UPI0035323DF9